MKVIDLIEIVGARQSGKTHLLDALFFNELEDGKTSIIVSFSLDPMSIRNQIRKIQDTLKKPFNPKVILIKGLTRPKISVIENGYYSDLKDITPTDRITEEVVEPKLYVDNADVGNVRFDMPYLRHFKYSQVTTTSLRTNSNNARAFATAIIQDNGLKYKVTNYNVSMRFLKEDERVFGNLLVTLRTIGLDNSVSTTLGAPLVLPVVSVKGKLYTF